MRSEPVQPVQARSRATRPEGTEGQGGAAAAQDAFEGALQRAWRGRRGPGEDGEAHEPLPEAAPQPLQASLPQPAAPRVEATPARWAPQPLVAPDALTRQLQVRALPDAPAEAGHWQLQITEAGLPVQRLDLQRSAAGPLTVVVSANAEAQQPQHAQRLRQRLARGGTRVDFRGASPEQEP